MKNFQKHFDPIFGVAFQVAAAVRISSRNSGYGRTIEDTPWTIPRLVVVWPTATATAAALLVRFCYYPPSKQIQTAATVAATIATTLDRSLNS